MRTEVGDPAVAREMRSGGYNLGGEQSGHVIFMDHSTTGDGIITALMMLTLMVETGRPMSELRAMHRVPQVMENVRVAARVPLAEMPDVQRLIAAAEKRLGAKWPPAGALLGHRDAGARDDRGRGPGRDRRARARDRRRDWQARRPRACLTMPRLGVNIDHVATLREARRVDYPDPVEAALAAERAGAGAITFHLREDRRHVQDRDLLRLRQEVHVRLNQELAPIDEMVELALKIRPHEVCLVPERREEITTEGGLDAAGLGVRLAPMIASLKQAGIGVSLFIDPEQHQIEAAAALGADFVEIHTGAYANLADQDLAERYLTGVDSPRALKDAKVKPGEATTAELRKIRDAVKIARAAGLKPNAGHGLNYGNVAPIAAIAGIQWLHIGHSIVARAIAVGMSRAVSEMLALTDTGHAAAPRIRAGGVRAARR